MRLRKKIYTVMLFAMVLAGSTCCDTLNSYYYSNSYILQYHEPTGISILSTGDNSFLFNIDRNGIYYDFRSNGEEKKTFDYLCRKNSDISYNKSIYLLGGSLFYDQISFEPSIEAISITSKSDFDEQHPAGTNLSDIIEIHFSSARDFVLNSYSEENISFSKVSVLSKLQKEDFALLLAENINCRFLKVPNSGIIKESLTLTINLDDNTKIEKDFEFDFNTIEVRNVVSR